MVSIHTTHFDKCQQIDISSHIIALHPILWLTIFRHIHSKSIPMKWNKLLQQMNHYSLSEFHGSFGANLKSGHSKKNAINENEKMKNCWNCGGFGRILFRRSSLYASTFSVFVFLMCIVICSHFFSGVSGVITTIQRFFFFSFLFSLILLLRVFFSSAIHIVNGVYLYNLFA